jgi:hypothetical protein
VAVDTPTVATTVKPAVLRARDQEEAIRHAAGRLGLTLAVSWPRSGNSATAHWMFNDRYGVRVLDWWPGTGRFWAPEGGRRGHAGCAAEALAVAAALAVVTGRIELPGAKGSDRPD